MQVRHVTALAIMIPTLAAAQGPGPLKYPDTRRADTVETLHGRSVPDPYRWLEDPNSAETKAWVEAQNKVTFGFLEQIPARAAIKERLTELWNYERYGTPSREGGWYFFAKNDGLQNQSVLYMHEIARRRAEILLDPNTLVEGRHRRPRRPRGQRRRQVPRVRLAAAGSRLAEWQVRDVATGKDLPDELKWVKFSAAAWIKDGKGFFYSRFDEPKEGETFTGVNNSRSSTSTSSARRRARTCWSTSGRTSRTGASAPTSPTTAASCHHRRQGHRQPQNRVVVQGPHEARCDRSQPFLDNFDAEYTFLGNDGRSFYFQTDQDAPQTASSPSTSRSRTSTDVEDDHPGGEGRTSSAACGWSATASSRVPEGRARRR